jgi:DNA-binding response OmpR family regulator
MAHRATHHRDVTAKPLAPQSLTPNVVVVCLPEQAERLAALRVAEVPRLVVVGAGTEPPQRVGDLEEWIQFPVGADELRDRLEALNARAARGPHEPPSLDADGLLHVGALWVALSATNEKLIALLLADFGRVVPTSALLRAVKGKARTIRPYITRLRQSVEPLGLAITSIRSRGYALNFAAAI